MSSGLLVRGSVRGLGLFVPLLLLGLQQMAALGDHYESGADLDVAVEVGFVGLVLTGVWGVVDGWRSGDAVQPWIVAGPALGLAWAVTGAVRNGVGDIYDESFVIVACACVVMVIGTCATVFGDIVHIAVRRRRAAG